MPSSFLVLTQNYSSSTKQMRAICICFSLWWTASVTAQHQVIDSIKSALDGKPKYFISFNHRNTIVHTSPTTLYGLIAGASFSSKVSLYAGGYGFSGIQETLLRQSRDFKADSIYRYVSSRNVSLGIEYTYYQFERLSLTAPLQIGFGSVSHEYKSADKTTLVLKEKSKMVPVEMGTTAYLELLPWVGIRGGFGYRLQLGKKAAFQYSSPYYSLGVSILLEQIYKDVKKKLES